MVVSPQALGTGQSRGWAVPKSWALCGWSGLIALTRVSDALLYRQARVQLGGRGKNQYHLLQSQERHSLLLEKKSIVLLAGS